MMLVQEDFLNILINNMINNIIAIPPTTLIPIIYGILEEELHGPVGPV